MVLRHDAITKFCDICKYRRRATPKQKIYQEPALDSQYAPVTPSLPHTHLSYSAPSPLIFFHLFITVKMKSPWICRNKKARTLDKSAKGDPISAPTETNLLHHVQPVADQASGRRIVLRHKHAAASKQRKSHRPPRVSDQTRQVRAHHKDSAARTRPCHPAKWWRQSARRVRVPGRGARRRGGWPSPWDEVAGDGEGHEAPPRRSVVHSQRRPLIHAPRPAHLATDPHFRLQQWRGAQELARQVHGCGGRGRRNTWARRTLPTALRMSVIHASHSSAVPTRAKYERCRRPPHEPRHQWRPLAHEWEPSATKPTLHFGPDHPTCPANRAETRRRLGAERPVRPRTGRTVAAAAFAGSSVAAATRISKAKLSLRPSCRPRHKTFKIVAPLVLLCSPCEWISACLRNRSSQSLPAACTISRFHYF